MQKLSTDTFKTCKVCGESKLISTFRKWLHTCKDCMRIIKKEKAKEYYHKHKDSPDFKAKARERFQRQKKEKREAYLQQKRESYLRNKGTYNASWHARRAAAFGATEIDRGISISKLLERDSSICGICGLPIIKNAKTRSERGSIDHIIPLKLGGQHVWGNVRAAHYGCNNSKGNRMDNTFSPNLSFLQKTNNLDKQALAVQLTIPYQTA